VARSRAYQELVEELTAALGKDVLLTGPEAARMSARVVHQRLRALRIELAEASHRGDALGDAVEGFLFGDLQQVELVMAWLAQRSVIEDDDAA
jgi:hypothetical protein